MNTLPFPARLYIGLVLLSGAGVFAALVPLDEFQQPALFVSLALLGAISGTFKVRLPIPAAGASVSISAAVDFASLLLIGANATMLVAIAAGWSQATFRTRKRAPLYRMLFNLMALVLTVQATGLAYRALGGGPAGSRWVVNGLALVGSATIYFLVNTGLVAAAGALAMRRPFLQSWRADYMWSAPGCFVSAAVAALVCPFVHGTGYWPILLAAIPLALTYAVYQVYLGRLSEAQRHVRRIADLHLATVEALARAIDAKDQTSHTHIRRIQHYAAALAGALGMSEFEVHGVRTAALLHDVGQLAVPEHILSKPGPLTHDEFQKVRTHPEMGAAILAGVPFPYPVAPLILGHHERWDGQGYPSGLRGEDIPLGARILSVVDYYDALTTDRPYHRAMAHESAVRLLEEESGHALDPIAVSQFVAILPQLLAETGTDREPSVQGAPRDQERTVFDDIALAHREIYTLYEIAHSLGTSLSVPETMDLVASKLKRLVPFSCCALFLEDEPARLLRCRFAAGVDAGLVDRVVIADGGGAVGFVARNRQPLVNVSPRADLAAAGLGSAATRLQAALLCPLVYHEQTLGVLALYHVDASAYAEDHRRLVARVAEQVAGVIHNSVIFEQTQHESLTDALTGLANIRFLYMHVARELARASRLESNVAFIVMDIDEFKEINDVFGHHVGDMVLQEVGGLLRQAVRPYDVCARYAGDEFIVILSGCTPEEAARKVQELQEVIEAHRFDGRPIRLGVSAGVAVFPQDGRSYESLLAFADSRMYCNKADRRRGHRPPAAAEANAARAALALAAGTPVY